MSEPYWIVHVVRSEPAFDIATRIQIGDEEGWIIPTSGHRAYPYWTSPTPLEDILYCYGKFMPQDMEPPADWPDHYSTLPAPRGQGLLSNLAEALGFAPKPIKIRRR